MYFSHRREASPHDPGFAFDLPVARDEPAEELVRRLIDRITADGPCKTAEPL